MADLENIHDALTLSNFGSVVGMAQRSQLAAQQREIKALLEQQLEEQLRESKRLHDLPPCPSCGQKLATVAKKCHCCHEPVAVIAGFGYDGESQNAVAFPIDQNLSANLHELYRAEVGVFVEAKALAEVMAERLRRPSLALLSTLESPAKDALDRINAANDQAAQMRRFFPQFLRLLLGSLLWVASIFVIRNIPQQESTQLLLFFIASPISIALLFHLVFHFPRNLKKTRDERLVLKQFTGNSVLQELFSDKPTSGKQSIELLKSLADHIEEQANKTDDAFYNVYAEDQLLSRIESCGKEHNVVLKRPTECRLSGDLLGLDFSPTSLDDFSLELRATLERLDSNINALTGTPHADSAAPRTKQPQDSTASEPAIWIRMPNGKTGGPFPESHLRLVKSNPKYPSETAWSRSPDGPWNPIRREAPPENASPGGSESPPKLCMWIRTPAGKKGGPFTQQQVRDAYKSGKIPPGSEYATSEDGPWKPLKR